MKHIKKRWTWVALWTLMPMILISACGTNEGVVGIDDCTNNALATDSPGNSGCTSDGDAGNNVTYIEQPGGSYQVNGYDLAFFAWNPPDGNIVTDGWLYYANPYFLGPEFAWLSIEGKATWVNDAHSSIRADFTEKSELDKGGTVVGPVTRFIVDIISGSLLSYEG